jgi:hypothetical protein
MDPARAAVALAVGIILALTLASGPLVGAVDFSQERYSTEGLGQGNATVSAVELPSTVTFEQGRYGAGAYNLRVPDARIRLEDVRGKPTVAYTVEVDELAYSRSTTSFLSPDSEGWLTLSIDQKPFDPSEIQNDSYQGRLEIVLRGSGNETLLGAKNVTITVDG